MFQLLPSLQGRYRGKLEVQFVLCILFVSEKSQFAQNSSGVGANINIYVMKCCSKYKKNVPKT